MTKRILIDSQTRYHAMHAMDSMDTFINNLNPFDRVPAYYILKRSLSKLSAITGIDYDELYETLENTDLSTYNLTWLRRLILKKKTEKRGRTCYGFRYEKDD